MHRNLARSEEYSKPTKRGEYQYVSGVMGIAYNLFLDSGAGKAHMNYEVPELLKFLTEKIIELDPVERERPSLGLTLEKIPGVISVPRSNKREELKMGNGNGMLVTNLGTVWKLLRPSWCPHPNASLIDEVTERVRLSSTKDEDLGKLNVVHKRFLSQCKESEKIKSKSTSVPEQKLFMPKCSGLIQIYGHFPLRTKSRTEILSTPKQRQNRPLQR